MKIGAVIVTYNPDIKILKDTLQFLISQSICTVVVDNDSKNINNFNNYNQNISYILETSNVGIAKALNDGIRYLKSEDIDWVLTLDQDTILPRNYFDEIRTITPEKDVSVYYPKVIDRNEPKSVAKKTLEKKAKIRAKNSNVLFLPIQSGAFMNIIDFYTIGGFDESLFIDNVDFDYFLEVLALGKSLIELSKTSIYQAVGMMTEKKIGPFKFHPTNHSAFRYYYIFRNMPVVIKRHKSILVERDSNMKNFYRATYKIVLKVILGEDNKIEKISAMIHGYKDRRNIKIKRRHYV